MPDVRVARAVGRACLLSAVVCGVSAAVAALASDDGSLASAGWVLATQAVLFVGAAFVAYGVDDTH
jgi:hypothetical protein